MLSDAQIKNLKPLKARRRYADYDGLYIEVGITGKKHWLYRYTQNGKRGWHSLGEYPMVGLREARELKDNARRQLYDGVPLSGTPQEEVHTFGEVALNWFSQLEQRLTSEKEKQTARSRIKNHVLPFLGDRPVEQIKPTDILSVIRRLEERGTLEVAHRVYQTCGRIFRFAVAAGLCERDPAADIKGAIMPVPQRHFSSITDPVQVGALLRAIDIYPGGVVRMAMMFSALTFCRPGEIRHAEWSEINGDEWKIAAEKMKMRRPHIVPLSLQAVDVLDKIKIISGSGRYVFPSA
ncbi:MAG: integrase arm-type DNA-binding domain-containing protein, partial [Synergistaceae bacterium]|nr:integrase arm-type DNA-binding domain-containing protein [Synergistaceae bacterium]